VVCIPVLGRHMAFGLQRAIGCMLDFVMMPVWVSHLLCDHITLGCFILLWLISLSLPTHPWLWM
jgi:hypothetical protein